MKNLLIYIFTLLLVAFSLVVKASLMYGFDDGPVGSATLTVHFPGLADDQNLHLYYNNKPMAALDKKDGTITLKKRIDGVYKFRIPVATTCYILLSKVTDDELAHDQVGQFVLRSHNFLNRGDNISLYIRPPNNRNSNFAREGCLTFSGKGALKLTVWNRIDSLMHAYKEIHPLYLDGNYLADNTQNRQIKLAFEYIRTHEKQLGQADFQRLLNNAIYDRKLAISTSVRHAAKSVDPEIRSHFINAYLNDTQYEELPAADSILANCIEFLDLTIARAGIKSVINSDRKENADDLYRELKKSTPPQWRDAVLARFFKQKNHLIKDFSNIYQDAVSTIRDQNALQNIQNYANRVSGVTAYDFELPDINGKKVKLSDLKDKVVFIDFWYTGCLACKQYFQYTLKEVEHLFAGNPNIIFVTISIDKNKEDWMKSVQNETYALRDGLNLYTEGLGSKHPAVKYYNVSAYPQLMVLTRDHRTFSFDSDVLRDKEKLIGVLQQALAER